MVAALDIDRRYRLRGAAAALWDSRDPEVLIEGPAGTGKTTAGLLVVFRDAERYPGSRQLICRKTRVSMTESVLVTWENKVVPVNHPCLTGAGRGQRQRYDFPNGSSVVVGGLDNPERTFSTEYDRVYVFEATEATEDDVEKLLRSLRNNVMPYQQLVCDCNPDAPTHWLNLRAAAGKMTRLLSRHVDNPSLTDEYLKRLAGLTGVRRSRLFEGKWVAAEGQVWADYDPAVHLIDSKRLVPIWEWRGQSAEDRAKDRRIVLRWFFATVDWGFRTAGCIQVWGVDGDGRMYRVREVYRSRQKVNDFWLPTALKLQDEFRIQAWACDPAEPEFIDTFRAAGLPAREANNEVIAGLDEVRDRLNPHQEGGARMFFCRDANRDRCPLLAEEKRPTGFEDEVWGYVFRKTQEGQVIREEPDPACWDHACDTTRYGAMFMARGRDLSEAETPKYEAGTMGAVLGHEVEEG